MLPLGTAYHFHEFSDLSPLLGSIARDDRILDATSDMVAQDFFLHASKRCPDRGNLRDDVDAIAILFDHANKTARPQDALLNQSGRSSLLVVMASRGPAPRDGSSRREDRGRKKETAA
jgi:hypothetical protein